MQTTIEIKKLDNYKDLPLPAYATELSAGMDLYAAIDEDININPGEIKIIPCGIAIALPKGFEAQIRPRSGLAAKSGITVLNSPGTIDADYRGELMVIMINHGKDNFIVKKAMRIAQIVIKKFEQVNWHLTDNLNNTERGVKGFGSTGS